MTRILTDGAESGDMSRINSGWQISTTHRTGTYSYRISGVGGAGSPTWILPSTYSEWYVRMAAYVTSGQNVYFAALSGGTTGFRLRPNSMGIGSTWSYEDGTTSRGNTSQFTWQSGEWHIIEIHVKHAASPNGVIQVKFDGILVANFTGSVNTVNNIDRIMCQATNGSSDMFVDDVAFNDTSGIIDNSWIGDGGVLSALVPIATGTYVGFLASGSATTWQSIDEIPANSTDFAYSSVSGTKSTFVMSDVSGLPAGASISRLWIELYAKETAATGDAVAPLLRSGITNVTGTSQSLTIAFARYISPEYTTDPNTSGTWSVTSVNAIEAGGVVE